MSWLLTGRMSFYSMIHLTCKITNPYYSVRWHDRELCNSLFERVFYCIYAIPHPDTYLWCLFCHFYIQNEVSHATNLARKFSFQKVWRDLDHEEERFRVANQGPTGFYQRVFLATKKAIWGLPKMPLTASSSTSKNQGAWLEETKPRKTSTWRSLL